MGCFSSSLDSIRGIEMARSPSQRSLFTTFFAHFDSFQILLRPQCPNPARVPREACEPLSFAAPFQSPTLPPPFPFGWHSGRQQTTKHRLHQHHGREAFQVKLFGSCCPVSSLLRHVAWNARTPRHTKTYIIMIIIIHHNRLTSRQCAQRTQTWHSESPISSTLATGSRWRPMANDR